MPPQQAPERTGMQFSSFLFLSFLGRKPLAGRARTAAAAHNYAEVLSESPPISALKKLGKGPARSDRAYDSDSAGVPERLWHVLGLSEPSRELMIRSGSLSRATN